MLPDQELQGGDYFGTTSVLHCVLRCSHGAIQALSSMSKYRITLHLTLKLSSIAWDMIDISTRVLDHIGEPSHAVQLALDPFFLSISQTSHWAGCVGFQAMGHLTRQKLDGPLILYAAIRGRTSISMTGCSTAGRRRTEVFINNEALISLAAVQCVI